jgi:hypothetical protein
MMTYAARQLTVLTIATLAFGYVPGVEAQSLSVIPGAFGFGMNTRAAYGCGAAPAVLRVTNLNNDGAGSFRAALTATGPRVVIFEISGTINLLSDININSPCLTIAGQTAPSPGITIKGDANASESAGGLNIFTHDVLIQHIRIRPGDGGVVIPATAAHNGIMIGYYGDVYNVIVDHCSFSWASGKLAQVAGPNKGSISFWRNIFAEALFRAKNVTPSQAATWGNEPSSIALHTVMSGGQSVSIIGNLFAHSSDRIGNPGEGVRQHFINNVVYDWGKDPANFPGAASLAFGVSDGISDPYYSNMIGNAFISGRGSVPFSPLYAFGVWNGDTGSKLYLNDNAIDQSAYPVNMYYQNPEARDPRVGSVALPIDGFQILPSSGVQSFVLANAGARPSDRDAVDTRIVNEVNSHSGNMISSQGQVGGWPSLAVNTRALTLPSSPHTVTGSGYTNLEVWLQGYAKALEGSTAPVSATPPAPPKNVRIVS